MGRDREGEVSGKRNGFDGVVRFEEFEGFGVNEKTRARSNRTSELY